MKKVQDLPVLELSLDPQKPPIRFLIDTGAYVSFIDSEYVPENSSERALSLSFPGGGQRIRRKVCVLELFHRGFKVIKETEFYSHTFPSELLPVQGILGMNAFLGEVFLLELPDRISIWNSPTSSIPPGFDENNLFPIAYRHGQPIFLFRRAEGTGQEAWIADTGAEFTAMDWEGFDEEELPKYQPGRSARVFNFGGGILSAVTKILNPFCTEFQNTAGISSMFCLPKLEVFPGGIPTQIVSKDPNKGIRGILGRNWLENFRILLDTKRNLLGIVGKGTKEQQ
ncbi:aspartyl protease [Leptospira perolatii]|uniref:aspartyl protease n=1 Tax=Leptospira perolatii TaxID=2023191 RepID=UPI001FAFB981|nr:aspartyl protease [Leptospira perolatii]